MRKRTSKRRLKRKYAKRYFIQTKIRTNSYRVYNASSSVIGWPYGAIDVLQEIITNGRKNWRFFIVKGASK